MSQIGTSPPSSSSPTSWMILLAVVCFANEADGRTSVSTLTVSNGGDKGNWGPEEFCPVDSFADGFWLKVYRCYESPDDCDDMAVTGIALECKHADGTAAGFIGSRYGPSFHPKGKWQQLKVCREDKPAFLMRFALKVQKPGKDQKLPPGKGGVDNTAVNNLRFQCTAGGEERAGRAGRAGRKIQGSGLSWYLGEFAGDFGNWSRACPENTSICGLATRVEQPNWAKSDSSGLNDVKFYCCRY